MTPIDPLFSRWSMMGVQRVGTTGDLVKGYTRVIHSVWPRHDSKRARRTNPIHPSSPSLRPHSHVVPSYYTRPATDGPRSATPLALLRPRISTTLRPLRLETILCPRARVDPTPPTLLHQDWTPGRFISRPTRRLGGREGRREEEGAPTCHERDSRNGRQDEG